MTPYELLYSEAAEKDLAAIADLSPHLLNFVETQLLRLAGNPVALSQPAHPPYPPDTQLFAFGYPIDDFGEEWRFSVHFRYGQDEQTLHILAIGRYQAGF